jgi:two-component system response regulator FixJ
VTTAFPQTVYIVDDDPEVRRSSWFMLSAAGLQPRVFSGGADFLGALPDLAPGVVLLDLRMPEITGFEVMQAIAASRNVLPVIVVTGHGHVSAAVRAMKLGAVDFIEKPYVDDDLIALIETAIGGYRDVQESRERRRVAERKLALLSPREREVLDLMLAGLPNKLIAYRLELSSRTVEMHRAKVMSRLDLASFSAVIRLAIAAGFDPAPTEQP